MTRPLTSAEISALSPIAVLDRSPLALAVALAALPVSKRNTIPILANLAMIGCADGLTVIGTDMDSEVRVTVTGAVDERLRTTAPAHMLKQILDKTRASELASIKAVEADELSRCNLDLGGVVFDLKALPYADFPDAFAWQTVGTSFTLPGKELVDMLAKVKMAMSCEETRYYLNGVYLHTINRPNEPTKLRTVATDGHRLEVMEIPAPEGAGNFSAIIPRATVAIVLESLRLIGKASKGVLPDVTIEVAKDLLPLGLRFRIGPSVIITTKTVDGVYPEYERCVPRHNDKHAAVSVKSLEDAVKQVCIINSDNKHRGVKLGFTSSKLAVTADNTDGEKATTSMSASYAADDLTIGYNSAYVLDFLGEMMGDEIALELADYGSPTLIRDPAEPRWYGVLMPMRV